MSLVGPRVQFLEAAGMLVWLAVGLRLVNRQCPQLTGFFIALLALPLALNFKHSFVRQDSAHTMHWFCFLSLCMAMLVLAMDFAQKRVTGLFCGILLVFLACWPNMVARGELRNAAGALTGMRTPDMLGPLLGQSGGLHRVLQARSDERFPVEARIEPEIKAIIGSAEVSSLSPAYSDLLLDGLHPALYPVVLRYTAYTPYLDNLNAQWVREQGPRFLVFNGGSIDDRHPWTDTPAMWAEVYRWYDLRLQGTRNVLLQRRAAPRFTELDLITRTRLHWGEEMAPPQSAGPLFWSMQCELSVSGRLRQLFFRIPEVTMDVEEHNGRQATFRFLPAIAIAPVAGNYLPSTLNEFAAIFDGGKTLNSAVEKIRFGGPGATAYGESCDLQWLRPK
jgi:hypothetical protein